jgi:putative hemolysin
MGLELPEREDYETIAGFVLHLLGRIPRQGERLRYKSMNLTITEMRGVKIEKILLTKKKHAAPSD